MEHISACSVKLFQKQCVWEHTRSKNVPSSDIVQGDRRNHTPWAHTAMLYRWKLSATHTECVCASCLQCSIPGAAICFSPNHRDCSCPMEPLLYRACQWSRNNMRSQLTTVSECSCFLSKPSHTPKRQQVNHMHLLLYFRILTFHLSLLIGAHLTGYNRGQSNGGWKSDRGKGFVGCVRQCNLAARRYSTVRRHSETESGQ